MDTEKRLGVSVLDNNKTQFAVFSQHATKIELCLFSDNEKKETKIPLTKDENNIWSIVLDNIQAGQKYGYRAHGEFSPEKGMYFNPNKLLIDPFAIEISKSIDDWNNPALLAENHLDSQKVTPKSIVAFDNPVLDAIKYPYLKKKPNHLWKDTIMYEAHVKGLTISHPDLPPEVRGKFTGISHPIMIKHLKDLGITHLELLPVTPTCGGKQLDKEKGLSNYWGYDPVNHFAIDPRYGSRDDFKAMVNELHKAGIEVGLDVVYNHSGEYGSDSNLISYKGLDCVNYYRLNKDNEFLNTTGCANSLDSNKEMGRVIEASLQYFSRNLGVDGFRFDLAGDCGLNENLKYDDNGNFMRIIRKIADEEKVKISGEPWSATGGYFRGHMNGLMEWSDINKDTIRQLYRGDSGIIPKIAGQISGGEGLYYGQTTCKYIKFVAIHDGFPINDVVNYDHKNNWNNNENNRDGCNNNYSSSSPSPEIAERRKKSMLAANILSRGVPMLCSGDEIGRTQNGNNNAYCHDNEISWLNWKNLTKEQKDLNHFICKVNNLRKKHPIFANIDTLSGNIVKENNRKDVEWLRPDGTEMQIHDWENPGNKSLALMLNGKGNKISPNQESRLKPSDDDFLIIISGNDYHEINYTLPPPPNNGQWQLVFDTSNDKIDNSCMKNITSYQVKPFSYVVLISKQKQDIKDLIKTFHLQNNNVNHR